MLIIRRRVGERIVVGSNIEVTVASATKKVVRLAISAPKGIPVLRGEVHDAVVAANLAATQAMVEIQSSESTGSDAGDGKMLEDEVFLAIDMAGFPPETQGCDSGEQQEKPNDSD